jgi:hypothetical protein
MKSFIIKKSMVCIIVILFLFSMISSYAVSEKNKVNEKYKTKRMVTFIEKSTGLNNPEKDGGKTELELADINNDGNLDIICVGDHGSPYVNSQQHGIMVWLGDGIDTWSVNQVGNFGYGGCEAGDLNLDGFLDITWGVHHDWGVPGFGDTLIGAALGDGTATNWVPWADGLGTGGEDYGMFATDLADFDCNGLLDIISLSFGCCNGYHMYENHGDGSWSHVWSLSGGNSYYNIEVGDFNSDGYADFVGNREGTYVFFGDGSFDFTLTQTGLPSSSWRGLDIGDMNRDGNDDLVIGFSSTGVKCYTFDKQSNDWDSESNGLPSSGTYYPQFGDVNGDGYLDIVAYSGPTGTLYLGDGNGNWEPDATFTMPSNGGYSAFVVDGDFDNDGREDIVIQAEEDDWPSYQNKLKAFSAYLEPSELTSNIQIPNGGETFRSGSIRKIRWLSAVPSAEDDSSVKIQVSLNGESGPWDTVVSNIPNNGCYQWLVDAGGSENCRIKIIVETSSDSVSSYSSSDFTIIGFNVYSNGPYFGEIGEPIQFSGTAENGSEPYNYYWDFGDGNTSEEQNPVHTYSDYGNYTAILSVTDGDYITIRDSTWVLIGGDNNPPSTPLINGPTKGKAGIDYNYSFISIDDEGDELYYLIDWGDGIEQVIGNFPQGTVANASHSWTNRGFYTITAKAGDQWGAMSDIGSLDIEIPRERNIVKSNFLQFLKNYFVTNNISEILNIILQINILDQGAKI